MLLKVSKQLLGLDIKMEKKGFALPWTHIISLTLVGILVVAIILFARPVFEEIKGKMGFGIDLTPEEIEAQNRARDIFNEDLIIILNSCKDSGDSACFCSDREIIFPTDYSLVFVDEGKDIKIYLDNQYGGLIKEATISDVDGCVGWVYGRDLSSFNASKDNTLILKYGNEFYLSFIDSVIGNEIRESIDPNYIFYKPKSDENYICILSSDYASSKDKSKICS